MVWRAGRCLRPCDRFSRPLSVVLQQLKVRVNEMNMVMVIVYL